jgi:hypothetical protein
MGVEVGHDLTDSASTLENWVREFERFSPNIDVVAYYGTQAERAGLRAELKDMARRKKLEVVLASYTQVGSNDDLSFFRKKIEFEVSPDGTFMRWCRWLTSRPAYMMKGTSSNLAPPRLTRT